MADRYIDTIASIIGDFDNHREKPEVYKALAWVGLKGNKKKGETTAWKGLLKKERSTIRKLKKDFERRRGGIPEYNLDSIELKSPAENNNSSDSNSSTSSSSWSTGSSSWSTSSSSWSTGITISGNGYGNSTGKIDSKYRKCLRYFDIQGYGIMDTPQSRTCIKHINRLGKLYGGNSNSYNEVWLQLYIKDDSGNKVGTVQVGPIVEVGPVKEKPMCSDCIEKPLLP